MARGKRDKAIVARPVDAELKKQEYQVDETVAVKEVNPFLRSWAWKREHRPDRDRFTKPYHHKITVSGEAFTIVIHQAPFSTAGFASTVWDSAIVLAKYLERWPEIVAGKGCIELGSGCGLAGVTAATLGAKKVMLTDFPENIPLLVRNCEANNLVEVMSTMPLIWGSKGSFREAEFDVILATDIMYYDEAVKPLLETLHALSGRGTKILLAYGRNRQAEETFMRALECSNFSMKRVPEDDLDIVYQCVDVDVFEIHLKECRVSTST